MKLLYQIGLVVVLFLCNFLTSCNGQTKESNKTTDKSQSVGGAFENRKFTYYGIPKTISSTDTSSGWNQNGQKWFIRHFSADRIKMCLNFLISFSKSDFALKCRKNRDYYKIYLNPIVTLRVRNTKSSEPVLPLFSVEKIVSLSPKHLRL